MKKGKFNHDAGFGPHGPIVGTTIDRQPIYMSPDLLNQSKPPSFFCGGVMNQSPIMNPNMINSTSADEDQRLRQHLPNNPVLITAMKQPTESDWIIAVSRNGNLLGSCLVQSEAICKAALAQNPSAACFLNPQFIYLLPQDENAVKLGKPKIDENQPEQQQEETVQVKFGNVDFGQHFMSMYGHLASTPDKLSKKKRNKVKTVGDFFRKYKDDNSKVLVCRIANFDFIVTLNPEPTDGEPEPVPQVLDIPVRYYKDYEEREQHLDHDYWIIEDVAVQWFLSHCQFDPEDNPFVVWLESV